MHLRVSSTRCCLQQRGRNPDGLNAPYRSVLDVGDEIRSIGPIRHSCAVAGLARLARTAATIYKYM